MAGAWTIVSVGMFRTESGPVDGPLVSIGGGPLGLPFDALAGD